MREDLSSLIRRTGPGNALLRLAADLIQIVHSLTWRPRPREFAVVQLHLNAGRLRWIPYRADRHHVCDLALGVIVKYDDVVFALEVRYESRLHRGLVPIRPLRLLSEINARPIEGLDLGGVEQRKRVP